MGAKIVSVANMLCPCDSQRQFAACCEPFLSGKAYATSAVALMRSRYCAFVLENRAYLLDTWHPTTRPKQLLFDPQARWLGLKINHTKAGGENDTEGWVSFVARYKIQGRGHRLSELSHFVREHGRWFYLNGEIA